MITGHQLVAGLDAKVRHVNDRGRIVCRHCQAVTGLQCLQAFTCFKDGQGAQQSRGIKFMYFFGHAAQIGAMFQCVHKVVTIRRGDAVTRMG